jgi:hypothetical protein
VQPKQTLLQPILIITPTLPPSSSWLTLFVRDPWVNGCESFPEVVIGQADELLAVVLGLYHLDAGGNCKSFKEWFLLFTGV